ncbi:MAG: peptidoglycan DD-metalloendopeptidase family protein [Balneolales bacterium]
MRFISYITVITAILFIFCMKADGQDYNRIRQELQDEQNKARSNIDALRQQIENAEKQISQTEGEYNRLFQEYQQKERELALREEIIKNLQKEGNHLNQELELNRKSIQELTNDLDRLILNYQKTLKYLYKNGRIPDIALILTAESINQMLVRSYYLNKFDDYRQRQADQIDEAQAELEKTKEELIDNQQRNEEILAEKQREQNTQRQRITQQEKNIQVIQSNQRAIKEQLARYESEVSELENTLKGFIEEEIRIRESESNRLRILEAERKKRLAEAEEAGDALAISRYSSPTRTARLTSSEEIAIVEEAFSKAKGEMPWPVESGVVSAGFGNKVNPLYGTKVNNPGVEIATESQSPVRVVHEGIVFAIQTLPGFGACVFVKHGRYITVYGNLSEIRVRKNTYVQAGDVIGLSGDDNSLKGQALFFMVRDGEVNLDPEQWITKK